MLHTHYDTILDYLSDYERAYASNPPIPSSKTLQQLTRKVILYAVQRVFLVTH
jgi:hypothetical protein